MRQRRAELRLEVIRVVDNLMAEFITKYIDAQAIGQNYTPSLQFFQSFQAAAADVKALFSDATFRVFKTMEEMIGPNLGPKHLQRTVNDFIQARDNALRALYKEAGLL